MKKKLFIILGLLTALIPIKASALNASLTLSCDKVVLKPGETTNCEVKGNTKEPINGLDFELTFGENLTYSDIVYSTAWQGEDPEPRVVLYTSNNKVGDFPAVTFKVKAADIKTGVTSNITLKNVGISDENFEMHYMEAKPLSIRIASTINTLNSLTVDNTLIEGFAADKTEYSFTVDSAKTSVTIGAAKTNEYSKITGDIGVKTLKYGINTFKVVVTSESGAAKNYVIKVNRPEIRELKTLTINETPVALGDGVYEYNINVENAITSLDIVAELANKDLVEFVKDFGPRTVKDLKVGTNEVLIKVDDKKGDVLTYKLVITRADAKKPNTNNNVKNPSTGDNNYFFLILAVGALGGVSYIKLRKLNKAGK